MELLGLCGWVLTLCGWVLSLELLSGLLALARGLALEKSLVDLSMKDATELRKMYKERLRSGPPEGSKGAGLGFIEMARRVQRFEFEIAETDKGPVFVYRGYVV